MNIKQSHLFYNGVTHPTPLIHNSHPRISQSSLLQLHVTSTYYIIIFSHKLPIDSPSHASLIIPLYLTSSTKSSIDSHGLRVLRRLERSIWFWWSAHLEFTTSNLPLFIHHFFVTLAGALSLSLSLPSFSSPTLVSSISLLSLFRRTISPSFSLNRSPGTLSSQQPAEP